MTSWHKSDLRYKVFIAAIGLLISADSGLADRDLFVATNGGHVSPYTNWAMAASNNIAAAVAVATNGDTVWVSNGVYVLSSTLALSKGYKIRNFSPNPDNTIIDGNQSVQCVSMTYTGAVLDGFTVTRGYTTGNGAGINMSGGMVTNCTIVSNVVGGLTSCGGGVYLAANCSVLNSRILYNLGTNTYPSGAGIYANAGGLIEDCNIASNTTPYAGGGIYIYGQDVCVLDSIIRSNNISVANQGAGGAGLYLSGGTVSNCFIADNISTSSAGGILISGAGFSILNCVISNNFGRSPGGGWQSGGGIMIKSVNSFTNYIRNCTIVGNRSIVGSGGGIACQDAGGVFENCWIINNIAPAAGGILSSTALILRDCLIAGNSTTNGKAGGIYLVAGTNRIENCTIVSNSATAEGGGISFLGRSGGTNTIINTILYFNTASDGSNWYSWGWSDPGIFTNCCMAPTNQSGAALGSGNFAADPKLVSVAGVNYRLLTGSRCIDAGLYQSWMDGVLDLDGHARIRYGTVDIGAYEHINEGTIYKLW